MSLCICDDANNLFLLYNHYFLKNSTKFPYASCLFFTGRSKKDLLSVNALMDSSNDIQYLPK